MCSYLSFLSLARLEAVHVLLPELPQLGQVGGGAGAAVVDGEGVIAELHGRQQLLLCQGHVHLILNIKIHLFLSYKFKRIGN